MGKAAQVVKERNCILCKQTLFTNSKGLRDHFKLCVRAARAGLVLPTIQKSKIEIVGG